MLLGHRRPCPQSPHRHRAPHLEACAKWPQQLTEDSLVDAVEAAEASFQSETVDVSVAVHFLGMLGILLRPDNVPLTRDLIDEARQATLAQPLLHHVSMGSMPTHSLHAFRLKDRS